MLEVINIASKISNARVTCSTIHDFTRTRAIGDVGMYVG